ncbi:hypothetical protein [Delftia acidovorans]|uniref:hypothetical protein n=1 Tax=Delftia acidovorans TaxID=80866 RepID=UPI0028B04F7B|nr:hypothetical protein [Delftia acidovorans]
MQDRVKQNRKNAIWAIPFAIVLLIADFYLIREIVIPETLDLFNLSPVVRITPLSPMIGSFWAIPLTLIVAVIANAIPFKKQTLKKVECILLSSTCVNIFFAAVGFFAILPLQYYAMPQLGYTHCNILEGHPNKYFMDWVKNPEWCVRGKSREWVKEQARLAQ